MSESADCYDVPRYWDLAFGEDTKLEADFIEAAAKKYCNAPVTSLLEPGCGGGRLVVELAQRGYQLTGWDLSHAAVDFANSRLRQQSLHGEVQVADMRTGNEATSTADKVDLAFCLVNTFRHLLTEEDAIQHLQTIATCLKPGGLYIIGMHLLPPDADEEDAEDWSVTELGTTVNMDLLVTSCDRSIRQEVLQFTMDIATADRSTQERYQSDYQMRIYEAADFCALIDKVPAFCLLDDVYDFWYDIDDPLKLSDELGDTVFILQRQ